jgi:hypothetical protein
MFDPRLDILPVAQRRLREELAATPLEQIADYETWCEERGKERERPYSGSLALRMRLTFIAMGTKPPIAPGGA